MTSKKPSPAAKGAPSRTVRTPKSARELVPVDSLKAFPGNARTHDLNVIRESLRVNGQYRPIVVRTRTRHVLAGNGTLEAAVAEGWQEIWATFVDCDAKAAQRINLVDNRANDLAGWDEQLLAKQLGDLPGVDGSGWAETELVQFVARADAQSVSREPSEPLGPLPELKAPFPWFGGKRRVASVVWDALGDVDNYVEPFAGSLAVLLGRPADHQGSTETVNDADSHLANFWRALVNDPAAVAEHCDWPANETDLFARHLWLVNQGRERIARLEQDPEFFDAKVAGWWVWGINSWIGSGWCSGTGPWLPDGSKLPHLGDAGRGVNRKRPHLGDAGQGVNRQLPHLGDAGQGVNRKRPHLGTAGQGIADYLLILAERLRGVRVCCGDWARVITDGAMAYGSSVGVFLDPPYLGDVRTADLYSTDDHQISHAVREWALAHGHDPRLRIVLAGYGPEHEAHMPSSWRALTYSASAAYQTTAQTGGTKGNQANRHQERLWFSPGCLNARQ